MGHPSHTRSPCSRCPRVVALRQSINVTNPDHWNRPVPADGPTSARLLIVGLAPGALGANRTGIPFAGDSSGDTLHLALETVGLTGNVRITNALKCLPPANRPTAIELANCRNFLQDDIATLMHQNGRKVIFALGRVAHGALVKTLSLRAADFAFAHGAVHEVEAGVFLVDSYHCSRLNTSTRRLTPAMLVDVLARAQGLLRNPDAVI